MLIAITRAVSPAINRCELGFIERQEISLAKAEEQHHLYEACLAELGAVVVSLASEPDYPDSVFVEDPAVVVDEVAVDRKSTRRVGEECRSRWSPFH